MHHKIAQEFFTHILNAGYIEPRTTKQLYCEQDAMFLADRYVTGTCPHCGFARARGDECGGCGKWLDPLELIEPACKICGEHAGGPRDDELVSAARQAAAEAGRVAARQRILERERQELRARVAG
ncbi:MAG: class I tRNA ligase family protein [Deltaproteobacteria bacterium]|nr:class I tRNA ligase family protein [Deltaproteobacteria bacterium]